MARLDSLDALRGIAVLFVGIYHLNVSFWRTSLTYDAEGVLISGHHFTDFMEMGVHLFFVISGFVISLPYLAQRNKKSWRKFFTRRFWRLTPAYYAAVFFSVFGLVFLQNRYITSTDIFAHASYMHIWFSDYAYSINAPFWSIGTEVWFYIMFPFSLIVISKIGIEKTVVTALLISVVIRAANFYVSADVSALRTDTWLFSANPLIRFGEWLTGAYLCKFYLKNGLNDGVISRLPLLLLFTICIGLYEIVIRHVDMLFLFKDYVLTLASIWLFLLVMRHYDKVSATAGATLLLNIGAISYTLYLIHFQVYSTADVLLCQVFGLEREPSMERAFILALALFLTYAVGLIFYTVFEKPFLKGIPPKVSS